jgi:hypothetical protein
MESATGSAFPPPQLLALPRTAHREPLGSAQQKQPPASQLQARAPAIFGFSSKFDFPSDYRYSRNCAMQVRDSSLLNVLRHFPIAMR